MDPENIDVSVPEKIHRSKEFDAIISNIADKVCPETRVAMDEVPCFAWLWLDPESSDGYCAVRSTCYVHGLCRLGHEQAQEVKNGFSPSHKRKHSYLLSLDKYKDGTVVSIEWDRLNPLVLSNKWVGRKKRKNERKKYVPMGRPVDVLFNVLISSLGNPPSLPLFWRITKFKKRYGHRGRMQISSSRSYAMVIIDGNPVARLWLNRAMRSRVEITTDLAQALRMTGRPIDVGKRHMDPNGRWGAHPERYYVTHPEEAKLLAATIISHYKLDIK